MRPLLYVETLVIVYAVMHRHFEKFKYEIYQNNENYYRYLQAGR